MDNLKIKSVINGKLNSLFMKKLIANKGWTKEYAKVLVIDFLTSKTKVSFYEYMVVA